MKMHLPEVALAPVAKTVACPSCGDTITADNAHYYAMTFSSQRVAHHDKRPACSPECLRAYAQSDGSPHDPAAPVREPVWNEERQQWVVPAIREKCPDHDPVDCQRCHNRGWFEHTPWFVHTDNPEAAHLNDGEVIVHVLESTPEHKLRYVVSQSGTVAHPDHIKEAWVFPHAKAALEWAHTPISPEEEASVRATFTALKAAKSEAAMKMAREAATIDAIAIDFEAAGEMQ